MGLTLYKTMVVRLFEKYASVNADCTRNFFNVRGENIMPFGGGVRDVSWSRNILNLNYASKPDKWNRQQVRNITCQFTGSFIAFEPLQGDLIIQEYDENYDDPWTSTLFEDFYIKGQYRRVPISSNIWAPIIFSDVKSWIDPKHGGMPSWIARIKWIEPTNDLGQTHDGAIQRKSGPMEIYLTYPSMTRSDKNCTIRVRKNAECVDPVGGIRAKLRFWEQVKYDPASNQKRFPDRPLMIRGAGNKNWDAVQMRATSAYAAERATRTRKKRQFLGATALSFATANRAAINTLRSQLNSRLKSMTNQMNIRFAKDDKRLMKIAKKLNTLSQANYVQEQRLNTVIITMMKEEQSTQGEIEWLQSEVTETQQIQLQQLDVFLHTVRDVRAMSLAELALDEMVMTELNSTTAKPLFDRSKIYLMRIQRGILYLKHYADKIEKLEQGQNETLRNETQ